MSHFVQEARPQTQGGYVERDTELMSPATQVVGDQDLYLGTAPSDIGRRIADDQLEMFVVCHPAEAMTQQLARRTPDFIALHDVGTATSARLLGAIAAASSRKLQKLVIRRQGYGVALATVQFVELPLAAGRSLRVYGTQVDADTQTRHRLAHVLLAHSKLAVVMVGELPAHALDSNLQPLREAIAQGPWPNRQMLIVPLASSATLPTLAASLAGHSGLTVRTTPQAGRPAVAWSYISGAWNRLNNAGNPTPPRTAAATATASTPPSKPEPVVAQALSLAAMPAVAGQPATAAAAAPAVGHAAPWNEYVRRCASIHGVQECCVFDIHVQRSLAHSGAQRTADRLAAKGTMLHALMCDSADVLGLGPAHPDATITLDKHHLLLRPMPAHPRVLLHMVLDREHGNVGQVRAQLHQIDQALLRGGA